MRRTREKGACIRERLREQLAAGATRGDETEEDERGRRSMCPCAAGGKTQSIRAADGEAKGWDLRKGL